MTASASLQIRDFMLGFAMGDAFGAGVEFQDRDWIRQHVDFTQLVDARTGKVLEGIDLGKDYQPGEYSDDTEMMVGTANAMITGQPLTAELLTYHWREEFERGIKLRGRPRNGHGSILWWYEGRMSLEELRSYQSGKELPGNGPLMRAALLGFLPQHARRQAARANAMATHPHPIAVEASLLLAEVSAISMSGTVNDAALLNTLVQELNLQTAVKGIPAILSQLPPPASLAAADYAHICGPQPIPSGQFPPGIYGVPTDALHSLTAILYVLLHAATPFEGLQMAVRLGGDTDTVAACVCGILAGQHRLSSFPDFMREEVEGIGYLMGTAHRLAAKLRDM